MTATPSAQDPPTSDSNFAEVAAHLSARLERVEPRVAVLREALVRLHDAAREHIERDTVATLRALVTALNAARAVL